MRFQIIQDLRARGAHREAGGEEAHAGEAVRPEPFGRRHEEERAESLRGGGGARPHVREARGEVREAHRGGAGAERQAPGAHRGVAAAPRAA